jgi:hypothetical protein
MDQAIQERLAAMRERAGNLLRQAISGHEPWVAALGPRPSDNRQARRWDETALAVAAYRDAWQVAGPRPLGEPSTLIQRQDAARIGPLLDRRPPVPEPTGRAVPDVVRTM